MAFPKNISKEHILSAIKELDKNGLGHYMDSRTYNVVHKGKTYPPKVLICTANKFANGREMSTREFGGTKARKFINELGFKIERKNVALYQKVSETDLISFLNKVNNDEIVNDFFDLVNELINFANLKDDGERYAFTITNKNHRISINIGNRIVLALQFIKGPRFRFMFSDKFGNKAKAIPGYITRESMREIFKNDPKGFILAYKPESNAHKDAWLINAWQESVLSFIPKVEKSKRAANNNPFIYKAAVDGNYRKQLMKKLKQNTSETNKTDWKSLLETDEIKKMMESEAFWFEKAEKLYQQFSQFKLNINENELFEIIENYKKSDQAFHEFLSTLPKDSTAYKFWLLAGKLIAHIDLNAANKNEWNENDDKRILARVGIRQTNWIEQLAKQKFDPNFKPSDGIFNMFSYLANPTQNITVASERHKALISENLLGINYTTTEKLVTDLDGYFEKDTWAIANEKNRTHIYAKLIYSKNIRNLWENKSENNPIKSQNAARYWAGGFGTDAEGDNRLNKFLKHNYWDAIYFEKNSDKRAAKKAWDSFNQISVNDYFIIKGYGGRNDLIVHYAGIVTNKIESEHRLDLKPINVELYKGKAPTGKGSGNWFHTLVEITRPDDIELLFGENAMEPDESKINMNTYPLNTIFYGPPGTGKTYNTVLRAAEITIGHAIDDYEEALQIFKENLGKQIEFITFHQNYSYEDFIQGLRPDTENDNELKFEKQDGIFKRIADRALENLNNARQPEIAKRSFDEVFIEFLTPLNDGDVEDIEIKMKKASFYITEVTQKSIAFRKNKGESVHTLSINTLKRMYEHGTNDIILGGLQPYYNPLLSALLSIGKKSIPKTEEKNYVIIIDEINRANISRVFGELITLIEPDKRSHGAISLSSILPSGDRFVVPSNLYLIGTMNTADKSIALLDIALRRRFEFEAMYPKYNLNGTEIYDTEILKKINEKIIKDKGHDFQIGHAYFMGENNSLNARMNKKVIPLLLEYYMNDEKAVKEVLKHAGLEVEDDTWPLKINGKRD